jgi:serine/threonine protein kinase
VYHIGSLHEKPHSKPSLASVLAPRHRSAHQQHPPSSQNPASSAALVNLVEMCLEIDPNRRPTAEELEQHPAFNAIS